MTLRSLYYQLWKWCATPDTFSVLTFMESLESLMIVYKKPTNLIWLLQEQNQIFGFLQLMQLAMGLRQNRVCRNQQFIITECLSPSCASRTSRRHTDIRSNERLIWWYNSEKFPMQNLSLTKMTKQQKMRRILGRTCSLWGFSICWLGGRAPSVPAVYSTPAGDH